MIKTSIRMIVAALFLVSAPQLGFANSLQERLTSWKETYFEKERVRLVFELNREKINREYNRRVSDLDHKHAILKRLLKKKHKATDRKKIQKAIRGNRKILSNLTVENLKSNEAFDQRLADLKIPFVLRVESEVDLIKAIWASEKVPENVKLNSGQIYLAILQRMLAADKANKDFTGFSRNQLLPPNWKQLADGTETGYQADGQTISSTPSGTPDQTGKPQKPVTCTGKTGCTQGSLCINKRCVKLKMARAQARCRTLHGGKGRLVPGPKRADGSNRWVCENPVFPSTNGFDLAGTWNCIWNGQRYKTSYKKTANGKFVADTGGYKADLRVLSQTKSSLTFRVKEAAGGNPYDWTILVSGTSFAWKPSAIDKHGGNCKK